VSDDTFGFDEAPFLEPAPDEEAWEAYLDFAMDRLGSDGSRGLTNAQLAVVEDALGTELPFEIGLLLVMGVPDDGWHDWRDDPAERLAAWNETVLGGITFDIRENGFWSPSFGPRPDDIDARLEAATRAYPELPTLFPIHGNRAVPVAAAPGFDSASGNPILSVVRTDVVVYADDLAGFLNRDFGVPLPLWQREGERRFTFWSELTAT
jgi:hypothetical protein